MTEGFFTRPSPPFYGEFNDSTVLGWLFFFSVRDAVSQVYEFSAKILLPLLIAFLPSASCLLGSQPPAERWRPFKDGQSNAFMNIICKLLWDGRHYINIRCHYY